MKTGTASPPTPRTRATSPRPIVALDLPTAEAALALVQRVPRADFVKVGLQLYTSAGPEIVRALTGRGLRVFLDLKLHDIPNTVAGAVRSAATLGVDLLTVHASGGSAMLRAAAEAARVSGDHLRILGVTVLTSLARDDLAEAWGRPGVHPSVEAIRLAGLSHDAGLHGVVASLHEAEAIRSRFADGLAILCPGIRLPGDPADDQARIGTPADASRLGVEYIVVGRSVTAAADPALAYEEVLRNLEAGSADMVDS